MKNLTRQTKSVKAKDVKRNWHLVDVAGQVLGRVSPGIARLLQGKNKTDYVPYLDVGDYVVVVNSKKVIVTGKKDETKIYTSYSGYPGGLKVKTFSSLMEKNSSHIIKHAVSGMLPKNKFREDRLNRLFIFPDENHQYKNKFIKL